MYKYFILTSLLTIILLNPVLAEDEIINLPEVKVSADEYSIPPLKEPIPDNEDGKILGAKKITITNLEALPDIVNNNYRQTFSQTPGLLVSEVPNDSLTSLSFRGLGDPHETFNINVLQDGTTINFDPYGYPANYYSPPSDFIDQVEFIHGGASLLYGPQPGGSLNFRTRSAPLDTSIAARTKHIFGSKNLYSTYNELAGTKENTSYLLAYHHKEFDGFRDVNSNSRIDFGSVKLGQRLTGSTKLFFEQDVYDSAFGEAGGLSLVPGENIADYNQDRWQSSLRFDTLSIRRYASTVGVEHEYDASTKIYGKLWGGYNSRNSKRQSYGTAPTFGGIANGTTNTIQLQEFRNVGMQTRASHDWDIGGEKQILATGITLYGVDSPFHSEQGQAPNAEDGLLQRSLDRTTFASAFYAENKFNYGKFSITPGIRVENIYQKIDETFNINPDAVLRETDSSDFVPLAGIGASYQLPDDYELYANFSQGFKPVTYQDTLPLGPADQVASDINEGRTNNYEVGVRGSPLTYVNLDTSLFYTTYTNQFGRIGQVIGNTGRGRYYGYDLGINLDVVTLSDDILETNNKKTIGVVNLYANASILDAEFTGGPLDGKTPQYAPKYLIKSGLVYNPTEQTKIAFLGTYTDSHFADDGNTSNFKIPSYKVWDLTADIELIKNRLTLIGGINNIFDEKYYSRIRGNGIDPSLPRNLYAGFNLQY